MIAYMKFDISFFVNPTCTKINFLVIPSGEKKEKNKNYVKKNIKTYLIVLVNSDNLGKNNSSRIL